MKNNNPDTDPKLIVFTLAIALPLFYPLYRWFHSPQCPLEYTQEQIDASNCIIGANIGGTPLFIISIPITIALSSLVARKIIERIEHKKK